MISIELKKVPKNVTIIEGFPGMGLISTIVTEFLIETLKAEKIGQFIYDDLPATVAVHKGELVHPMGIFYAKSKNLVILHTILNPKGYEWKVANAIKDLSTKTSAKEILSIEGVLGETGNKIYCFNNKKLSKLGCESIQESIIMGVTGALLLKNKNVSCLFGETASQMPDSRAAANIIEVLDKYFEMNIDVKPLLKQAKEFETKIKGMIDKTNESTEVADKKQMSYLG